jgi:hypothetical protein
LIFERVEDCRNRGGEGRDERVGGRRGVVDELVGVEESHWRSVRGFGSLCVALTSRQGVRLTHLAARSVDDGGTVLLKYVEPANVTTLEDTGGGPVLKVLVIGANSDTWTAVEIASPGGETLNNSKHLLVVDVVVEFGVLKLAREEGEGVERTVGGRLGGDTTETNVRGVSFDDDGLTRLEMAEDGSRREGGLEGVEGVLLIVVPGELDTFT